MLIWNVTLSIFCCKFNNEATSSELSVRETVYQNKKVATASVNSTCEYETSVFYMGDAFEALRRLYEYVKGVRTIPVDLSQSGMPLLT